MARLTYRLLGSLEVANDDGLVNVGPAKPRALLTMLLLNANRVLASDVLVDQLWNGEPPASAAVTLQGYVSGLRKALGSAGDGQPLQRRAPGYVLAVEPGQLDIDEFERLAAAGQAALDGTEWSLAAGHFLAGRGLWRGRALADVADEPWAQARATQLEEARLVALDGWFTAELACGRHAEIIGAIEEAIATWPLREQLHHHLMVALYRSGRQADALRSFQRLRGALIDELGIEPTPALASLEASILAQDASLDWRDIRGPGRPATDSWESTLDTASHARPATNLRAPLTPLIGRAAEITDLSDMVRHNRLVTITGPGGAGKTRLAHEVASRLSDGFTSGAWMVELAPVSDPREVVDAVAVALQLAEPGMNAIVEFLRDRMILLVVDNCEHVIDAAAALLGELLAANPLLFVIATSREPLFVPGEHSYAIPPLDQDEAVELFTTRARAASDAVALDESTAAAIDSICRRLQGMPLAVELAAARCRTFSPSQLATRLADSFDLLAGGSRTSEPRQRSVRNVVEWSYNLLFGDEQLLFQRLSLFRGTYTIEAVEAICSDENLPALTIADTLARLVDKSVVQVRPTGAGENRFTMLEMLVEYAHEQLTADERDRLADRHADHYAALASLGVIGRLGNEQRMWLDTIAREQDNIRAALAWSVRAGTTDTARAAAMVGGLGWYWWSAGAVHEGWRWASQATELAPPQSLRTAALSSTWTAFLGACCEQNDVISPIVTSAAELVAQLWEEDPRGTAFCRALLAKVELLRGDIDAARGLLADTLALVAGRGDAPWFESTSLYLRGQLAHLEGRADEALPLLHRSSVLEERSGDLASATIVFAELGLVAEAVGDLDLMRAALDDARRIAAELGLTSLELTMAARVANAAVKQGREEEAETLLGEVIDWARAVAHRPALAFATSGLARLRFRQGRVAEAAAAAREALALPMFERFRVVDALDEIIAAAEKDPTRTTPSS